MEDFKFSIKLYLEFTVSIKRFKALYGIGDHSSIFEELVTLSLFPNEKLLPIDILYMN